MKKYYLLFILLLSFSFNEIRACGCTTDGPFLQVSIDAELIAVVEVQDYLSYEELMGEDVPMSMTLKIRKVLKGSETREEITVWGNNGLMCSPYLSLFEIGTKWVMAFKSSPTEGHMDAKAEDYGISNCGEHFMKVESGIVRGLIKGGDTYQSMSISTLKRNLDIINRNQSRIDKDKCRLIKNLQEQGIDTIGVFENYHINKIIRSLKLSATFQMVLDDDFPSFYEYMKGANITRQIFVYWQSDGIVYVKQIDDFFEHDAVEVSNETFFKTYYEYKQWLLPERLQIRSKVKTTNRKNKPIKEKKVKEKANLAKIEKVPEAYVLQSFQLFIDGEVLLKDFDTRLFDKVYNKKMYKKNRKTLTYQWLLLMTKESEAIAEKNAQSHNLFKQYKQMYSVR